MKVSAIVFDGSGTLIDDIWAVWSADRAAFESLGYKFAENIEKFKEIFRFPIPDFYKANGVPEDMIPKMYQTFRKLFPKFSNSNKIFPDVKDALSEFKRDGILLGVASNIPSLFLKETLERFGILEYFGEITGQDDCDEQKPSPKPILSTLVKLGVKPKYSMYVGDMVEDMIAGKRAGVITVAISRENSYHPAMRLKRENPDFSISNLNELVAIVKKQTQNPIME
jgi:HAD superfamily hydrolase (TIGR01549 family)